LLGLLAVLAFVILAAVILRREPGKVAEAPPASPVPPPTTTTTTLASPPLIAPPSTEPAAPAASAEPTTTPAETPPPSKPGRTARRGAAPASGGTRVAETDPMSGRVGSTSVSPSGPSPRRFVLGTTSIESLKPVVRDIKGFEVGDVGVKRAPEVNGRVVLEMDPPQVRPGVDYTVKVYLANDGNKDIPVQEVKISTVETGKSASRTMAPLTRSVKPQQRALLHEASGVWREAARSWSMDVVVTSTRQDVYRNRLNWE
jgi:hypothetical protein